MEFNFGRSDAKINKWLFDQLFQQIEEIESSFGNRINWLRLYNKKVSRLQYATARDGYDRDQWPEYVLWHVEHIKKLQKALHELIFELNQKLKNKYSSGNDYSN